MHCDGRVNVFVLKVVCVLYDFHFQINYKNKSEKIEINFKAFRIKARMLYFRTLK